MDAVFIEGWGATISAIIVFCGSVFLLLAMIMGARLAYFITASVTLAFLLILGLIWSFTNPLTPLGPVGVLPEWESISVAEQGAPLEGPSASSYPDGGGWAEVDQEDTEQTSHAAELGSSAQDAIATEVEDGALPDGTENNTADTDSIRFLEQDGDLYGAVELAPPAEAEEDAEETTPAEGEEPAEPPPTVVVLMQFDPGNPLGSARFFLLLTVVALVIHLFFLSRSETKARKAKEATV